MVSPSWCFGSNLMSPFIVLWSLWHLTWFGIIGLGDQLTRQLLFHVSKASLRSRCKLTGFPSHKTFSRGLLFYIDRMYGLTNCIFILFTKLIQNGWLTGDVGLNNLHFLKSIHEQHIDRVAIVNKYTFSQVISNTKGNNKCIIVRV